VSLAQLAVKGDEELSRLLADVTIAGVFSMNRGRGGGGGAHKSRAKMYMHAVNKNEGLFITQLVLRQPVPICRRRRGAAPDPARSLAEAEQRNQNQDGACWIAHESMAQLRQYEHSILNKVDLFTNQHAALVIHGIVNEIARLLLIRYNVDGVMQRYMAAPS
jgi:hypothetical protein